ncbi:hypothetical protein OUZ56_007404 [Daphnia magna]|uniref:Uncharacterized protein n=1 Tax=Daphnia magna TaxID=35525 RepID=A0ABR0A9V1_9CRUS|nr:hypothetical protein OUZ56_007404 [Daphnia magna]
MKFIELFKWLFKRRHFEEWNTFSPPDELLSALRHRLKFHSEPWFDRYEPDEHNIVLRERLFPLCINPSSYATILRVDFTKKKKTGVVVHVPKDKMESRSAFRGIVLLSTTSA